MGHSLRFAARALVLAARYLLAEILLSAILLGDSPGPAGW
jgi:hypothetical protein